MTDKHARQQEDTSFAFSQDASFNFLDQNNVSMLNRSMGSIHSPSLTKRSGHHLGSQTAGGSGSLTNGLNNAGGDYDDDYFFDQSEDSKLKFDFDALNDEDPNDTMTSLPGDRKGISTTSAMGNRGINGRGSVPNKNARSTTEKDKDKKTNMTLKEQEKIIDELKKDNFGLKLKIYFLEERLAQLSPDQVDEALKENIDLKVKIQTLVQEVKKYKKMILELQSAMEILREKGSCDLPHGMSEDQQEEYERAMASAKESKQESDHLHQKLAELSSEMTRLRDLLRNQKAKEFGILSEDEKEYLVQEKNRAISETEKYRQELQQAKSMIEEQTRTIRHLRDQGMMAPSNDVLQTILIERDNALAQADLMANHVSEMRSALTTQTEINRALQHDRDMAKAEAEQLAKSVLELGQQEMVLNMELDRVATISERNAQGLQDSVRMKQESDTSMISREKLEEEREMIKKLSDDIASYKSQVSAQQTLIQNHENENGQLLDELELLKAREARLSQMLGIDPDDEEEMQLREKMEEDGVRSEFEILAWKSERVEASIAQLRDRNAELTIQLREKESEIDQLQAEIEDILEVTESKARDIQRLREVNAGLKEDLQHLRQENDALVPQLEEANRALREEELAHQEDVARMDSELDARERECASLENELEKLAEHMENMEETLQQKETRLGELEGQLEAKTQMASKAEQMYEEDVLQLEEQLALMKERNSELFVANHNATADIAHLRDEVTHYASTTDELEGRYRQEASRRASLEKSLKEEKDERAKEKDARAKEQDERVKERDAVEKERSRLIMEKDAADKDRGRLLMERDAAEKERVRLMMEKDVAEKEKMRLLMERDALAREKDKLELEKTRLKLEAEEDGRKWEELVKELELKIARLTSSIGDRDSTMDYLKQQINVQNDKAREIVDQYMEKLDAARKEMEQRIQERDFAREEIDKLKREVIERRADISQAKENLERWGAQNKKLSEQIKEVSDAKGHLEEMLLSATQELREKTGTINTLTAQAGDLEFRLNEQESLVASEEAKYRDQITERNTLLLTIYQYADSLVGAPQNGVSRSSSTRNIPKPNTNFPLFHEHIIAKLKTLSRLTQTFEKRAKELYDRCQEQFSVMEKQADIQSSRIDRCNKHVKNMKDNSSLSFTQAAKYRTLLDKKTVELEAARSSKIELETQITALRDKITDLSGIDVRAKHFKGRAQEMQGKLVESEEVWKSRVRELESRVKDTDDRTRRERKGAQDKIEALQENIKNLEKKLEAATRKSDNLSDLVDQYKTSLEAKTEINNLKAENVVSKLNDQLREELDEKIKALDSERQNAKDRENQYATLHEEWKKLQKQLARRDNMITKALERLENINERKEVMENVLLRQVTQDIDATLRMRADSVMGNVSDDKRPPATTEEPQPNVSKTTGSPISDRSESPFGRSRSPNQKPVGTSGGLRSKSPAVPGMARAKSVISPAPIVKKTLVNPPKTGYLSTANGKTVATKTPAATAASPVKTRKA